LLNPSDNSVEYTALGHPVCIRLAILVIVIAVLSICKTCLNVICLGELGGNMGLFLGCSILTLCEFIQFLVDTVISRIKKSSKNVIPEVNNP